MCKKERIYSKRRRNSFSINKKGNYLMDLKKQTKSECCTTENKSSSCGTSEPVILSLEKKSSCCEPAAGSDIISLTGPGDTSHHFIVETIETPAGSVPRVKTVLQPSDRFGIVMMRLGIGRNHYQITPGLYCVGTPDKESPVMVTGNYKLSFDLLREGLDGLNCWILVLDTKGVNVWCAAGKGTFATDELNFRVKQTDLEKVVSHRQLVLPQLSATGVAAHLVKKGCGFKVIWGPIKVKDIKKFLENKLKPDDKMRQVTFSIAERLVLVPVEIKGVLKPAAITFIVIFLISGISPEIFSFQLMLSRGTQAVMSALSGIFLGAVVTPILLPWIPTRAFSVKGALTGALGWIVYVYLFGDGTMTMATASLFLFSTAVSSYLAMNFTGSTPFTSPSGVEKEMRIAIPLQAVAVLVALVGWITSTFLT